MAFKAHHLFWYEMGYWRSDGWWNRDGTAKKARKSLMFVWRKKLVGPRV